MVSGYQALNSALMLSNFINYTTRFPNRTMHIQITNETASHFTLYCRKGDTCIVDCNFNGTCAAITFYCGGDCFVNYLFVGMCNIYLIGVKLKTSCAHVQREKKLHWNK